MDFRELSTEERTKMLDALRGNVYGGTILMDRQTTFAGTADDVDEDEEQTINAIRAIPCHY